VGVSCTHFRRLLARHLNRHELSFAYAWTPRGSLVPFPSALYQLRPKRKDSALRRFDLVDGAAAMAKKNTLTVSRGAKTASIFRPINESVFKLLSGHGEKPGRALDVALGEIHKSLLLAALGAPRLALETHAVIVYGLLESSGNIPELSF
jgi:hypothetical protein